MLNDPTVQELLVDVTSDEKTVLRLLNVYWRVKRLI